MGVIGIGLATVAVLCKLYFDVRAVQADDDKAHGGHPLALALMATGGLTVIAGVALVLTDPWGNADAATIAAVLGGPALFLLGDLAARRAASGRVAVSRILALASLAVIALIAFALPALVLAALALAVLLLLLLAASGWFRLPSMSVND
ncbi:low temperature requirement protein A [Glycomyces sp. NPDC048151]|uniref:low temperature requirement protein A n=1 Tax=Glycomyces sp. NPDC048151 TaxID=3364002 RepID=UPI0037223430